ncbi:hypothetical protein [Clostridium saccharoperbutylacetonicum]|uniref:hypothetical protein n=1 Tax=Clostridium saccharoperbutylacetonicum TaxID=36745 RepID=UPI000983CCD9|nr:hypothetical protein [Clostridium saccharoperbutylacetonicum]AQR95570.1 hypothetical protein CLSAP_28860 [Clostridium saccharoperbutylacetonicum]NSB31430.1 hypothetical protein [Clostridium saccharoperbutylacetonicum]
MNKKLIRKLSLGIIVVLGFSIICFISWNIYDDKNKPVQTSNTTISQHLYNPTAEEKTVLKKSYEDLIGGSDYTIYSDLDEKYDSMNESERKNIKTDIERLRKEKNTYDNECEKQSEQNKQAYTDITKEIESSYPNMKVFSIYGKDDKKSLLIYMNLLKNIKETEEAACSLTIMKETRMKEIGINDICIFIQDSNKKSHGSIIFKLSQGEYKPFANTIN